MLRLVKLQKVGQMSIICQTVLCLSAVNSDHCGTCFNGKKPDMIYVCFGNTSSLGEAQATVVYFTQLVPLYWTLDVTHKLFVFKVKSTFFSGNIHGLSQSSPPSTAPVTPQCICGNKLVKCEAYSS